MATSFVFLVAASYGSRLATINGVSFVTNLR